VHGRCAHQRFSHRMGLRNRCQPRIEHAGKREQIVTLVL
jgi:hypothetical protein